MMKCCAEASIVSRFGVYVGKAGPKVGRNIVVVVIGVKSEPSLTEERRWKGATGRRYGVCEFINKHSAVM
jgi:DNA-binding Lrp family transcriptional regulator